MFNIFKRFSNNFLRYKWIDSETRTAPNVIDAQRIILPGEFAISNENI